MGSPSDGFSDPSAASLFFVQEKPVLLAIILLAIALVLSYRVLEDAPHEDSY